MAITKESVGIAVETVKDFFKDLLRPNMQLEDIKQITFPRFQELIKNYTQKGYNYGGGKFYVKYVDEKHFKLEFEMYFRDEEEHWHKISNESELRDIKLLEDSLINTMKTLKTAEFSIDAPTPEKSDKNIEQITPPSDVIDVEVSESTR
ncbi:MAG: hypothetical protein IKZ58_06560 [Selenomonadaceae bacterium]|nr:hypothetical protein [Selenomonadaceae bacterium]